MPFSPAFPDGPRPWNWMLRKVTISVAPAATLMPLVPAARVDRDRLGDRHRAEAAGIEGIDLSAGRGFRDCPGECLARCGAAARIGVVADAGHPGAGCLRLSAARP